MITGQTTIAELEKELLLLRGRFLNTKADLHVSPIFNGWQASSVSLGGNGATLAEAIQAVLEHHRLWNKRIDGLKSND